MGKTKTKEMTGSPVEEQATKKQLVLVVEKTANSSGLVTAKKAKSSQQGKKHIKIRSKKYQVAAKQIDKSKSYPLEEAIKLARETSYSNYDGSLEIHINTKVKGLRGLVSLPFASSKKLRVVAFGRGAAESGADMIGDEALLGELAKGKINFDALITTPEWMSKLAPLARVLGPRGVMPNPKNGTIANDLAKAVAEIQTGKTEYRPEPSGRVIHLSIGKISQPPEQLSQNAKVLLSAIGKSRIAKVVLSPSLGPGIKVDYSSI